MKVLVVSRSFPSGHPKKGQPTYFVEKILNALRFASGSLPSEMQAMIYRYEFNGGNIERDFDLSIKKVHTIRVGARFKDGDMASLRIWSDKPYRSKQIEFAQVEVKRVIPIKIYINWANFNVYYENTDGRTLRMDLDKVARNDGLSAEDFTSWFNIHPKTKASVFTGQIICWQDPGY